MKTLSRYGVRAQTNRFRKTAIFKTGDWEGTGGAQCTQLRSYTVHVGAQKKLGLALGDIQLGEKNVSKLQASALEIKRQALRVMGSAEPHGNSPLARPPTTTAPTFKKPPRVGC